MRGLNMMTVMLEREKGIQSAVHTGRQYTNEAGILQEGKSKTGQSLLLRTT
jgi:hypothetical protein